MYFIPFVAHDYYSKTVILTGVNIAYKAHAQDKLQHELLSIS